MAASHSFISAYHPEALIVVNAGLRLDGEEHGTKVLYRPPWDLAACFTPLA